MKKLAVTSWSSFVALLMTACGPAVEIVGPRENGAVVKTSEDGKAMIITELHGFELAGPGLCGNHESCGHYFVRLTADEQTGPNSWIGVTCGDAHESASKAVVVDLSTCPRQTGLFSVLVVLHDDDHVYLEGPGVAASRRFVVEE